MMLIFGEEKNHQQHTHTHTHHKSPSHCGKRKSQLIHTLSLMTGFLCLKKLWKMNEQGKLRSDMQSSIPGILAAGKHAKYTIYPDLFQAYKKEPSINLWLLC